MSAEIPLDADASHPEEAPECSTSPSNLSPTHKERETDTERERKIMLKGY